MTYSYDPTGWEDEPSVAAPEAPRRASTLQPLGLGDLLDRSFSFYRRHFLPMLGIVSVLVIPLAFLQMVVAAGNVLFLLEGEGDFSAPVILGGIFSLLFGILYALVLAPLGTGAISLGVAEGTFHPDRPLRAIELLRRAASHIGNLVGSYLLIGVLTIVFAITLIIPPIGMALLIFSSTVWIIIAPVVVLERVGPTRSLPRAWNLTKRSFWRVFGYIFLLQVLGQVIVGIPVGLLSFAGTLLFALVSPVVAQIVNVLVSSLASLIWTPFSLIAISLLYLDLRVRHEGLDLAAQNEALTGDPMRALDPPPPPDESLFTSETMRALGILAGISVLIFGFFCACVFGIGALANMGNGN